MRELPSAHERANERANQPKKEIKNYKKRKQREQRPNLSGEIKRHFTETLGFRREVEKKKLEKRPRKIIS